MSLYDEDEKAFDDWFNKPIDWDVVGSPITQGHAIKWSRDTELEQTGIPNMFWIKQAFIAGRESTRPKPEPLDTEEAFKKLQEYIKRAREQNDNQNKSSEQ